jgi:hypothetical protein
MGVGAMERWWGVCDGKRRTDGGKRQGEVFLFKRYKKQHIRFEE